MASKTITRRAINAALDRIDNIRASYLYPGQTGVVERNQTLLEQAACEVYDNGRVTIHLYGVGDAREERHYFGRYPYDAVNVLHEWMQGNIDRTEAVALIQAGWLAATDAQSGDWRREYWTELVQL